MWAPLPHERGRLGTIGEMMIWLQVWIADRRRWLGTTLLLSALGLAWMLAASVPSAASTSGRIPSPREGFLAPRFELEDLHGTLVALGDLEGQVVIINFWASWCPPCRAEMPALERVYQSRRDQGLEILAVNTTYQDNLPAATAFVDEFGMTFPVLLERRGDVARTYLIRALPTTFFVDREGVIRKVIIGGPMSETTLQSTVESLLGEAE